MLTRDECVFAQSYSLLYGLCPDDASKPVVVGGKAPNACRDMDTIDGLRKEDLAPGTKDGTIKNIQN